VSYNVRNRSANHRLIYWQQRAGFNNTRLAAAKLAELARRSIEQRGFARHIPVVFSSWRDEPTGELIAEIAGTTALKLTGKVSSARVRDRLNEFLHETSPHASTPVIADLRSRILNLLAT